MTPQHQQLAASAVRMILDQCQDPATRPGQIVLAKYESQLDYQTLRPEDQPATVEDHRELIDRIAAGLAASLPADIPITTPVINTSSYLRWLAANGLTNNPQNRAAYIANPA